MLGYERDALALAIMLYRYADAFESKSGDGMVQLAMHAFHDGVKQASLMVMQTFDGRIAPEQALRQVAGYGLALEGALSDREEEDGE